MESIHNASCKKLVEMGVIFYEVDSECVVGDTFEGEADTVLMMPTEDRVVGWYHTHIFGFTEPSLPDLRIAVDQGCAFLIISDAIGNFSCSLPNCDNIQRLDLLIDDKVKRENRMYEPLKKIVESLIKESAFDDDSMDAIELFMEGRYEDTPELFAYVINIIDTADKSPIVWHQFNTHKQEIEEYRATVKSAIQLYSNLYTVIRRHRYVKRDT